MTTVLLSGICGTCVRNLYDISPNLGALLVLHLHVDVRRSNRAKKSKPWATGPTLLLNLPHKPTHSRGNSANTNRVTM